MTDIGTAKVVDQTHDIVRYKRKDLHQDVGGVLLHGLDTNTVTSGAASTELGPVISTEDEGVSVGVGEVLRQSGGLGNVVAVAKLSANCQGMQGLALTHVPWSGRQ